MATFVDAHRPAAGHRRPRAQSRVRLDVVGPVLVVAVLLGIAVAGGLVACSGNPLGFVRFGRAFAGVIHPPRAAIVVPGTGYDGQYFWALGTDPLLLRPTTLVPFVAQSFRLQRIAYPALAWLVSGGRTAGLGWSLLVVNLAVILGATAAFALYARRRCWSGWWSLALGLLPGFGYALLGDLSDALATLAMLGGLICWRHRRGGLAAGLLACACLAREPMVLAVLAVACEAVLQRRAAGAEWRATLRALLIAPVLVPAIAFGAWQIYIHIRLGASTSAPATAFAPPLSQFLLEAGRALRAGRAIDGAWDVAYLAGMLVGIGLAVAHATRRACAPALAAAGFGLILPVLVFGGAWSYARLSAPMFACLLLVGLERRSRPTLALSIAAAALGALVPLSVG